MTDVPGTPPPSAGAPAPGAVPTATAGLGARFAARLLDVLIVGIPAAIIFGILGWTAGGFGMQGWLGNAVFSLLWFGYYVYFESTSGATLGKKLTNIRVVTADGSTPSTETAAKRNIWMLFGIVPLVGGIAQFVAVVVIAVTINSGAHNRGKHDEFAGTAVMA